MWSDNDFRKIFNEYFPSLCVFANRFVKDEEIAKDMAQESMLKILESKHKFKSEKSMRVYFFLTTKNTCLNYIRSLKNHHYMNIDEKSFDLDTVTSEITREEVYIKLDKAISNLEIKQRDVIDLAIKGYSMKEISEKLKISINTIKSRKLSAYKNIRDFFNTTAVSCYILLLVKIFFQ